MEHALNDGRTIFENDLHRYILTRHIAGAMIKTIVEELAARGTPRERKAVWRTIRRYGIAWNIKKVKRRPTQ